MTNQKAPTDLHSNPHYPDKLREKEAKLVHQRRLAADDERQETRELVGLALSGGGIRSATFCVGVLQGLAGFGLLRKVDFLSTVSGGGYAGSFLGRMFTREWAAPAQAAAPVEPQATPRCLQGNAAPTRPAARVERVLDDHHSEPLRWLRDCGRYMSPNGAGDTLVAVAAYLRNWISVTAVMWTFLLTVFLLLAAVRAGLGDWSAGWRGLEIRLAGWTEQHWWWSPLLLVPAGLTLFGLVPLGWAFWLTRKQLRSPETAGSVAALVVLLMLGARFGWWALVAVTLLTVVFSAAAELDWQRPAAGSAGGAGWRGWLTRVSPATQRNRLTRRLAWMLRATLLCLGLTLVDSLGQTAYALLRHALAQADGGWSVGLAQFASLSGLGALLAFASRIKQMLDALPDQNRVQIPLNVVATAAAFTLLVVTLVGLAAVANGVAWQGRHPAFCCIIPGVNLRQQLEPKQQVDLSVEGHVAVTDAKKLAVPEAADLAEAMSFGWAGGAGLISLVLTWLFGQTMSFLNFSSHQPLYSARLTRAYQGASNPARWAGTGQKISEALASDDVGWADYRPHEHGGPLHLVNVTLNETVSGKSQIEFRDRQGLPMAVGPAGVSVGARHHGQWTSLAAGAGRAGLEPIPTGTPTQPKYHALAADERSAQEVEALPLGQWVGISGAAFTTGLGAGTSLGKSLLLGLANIRLGYWWDSQITPRQRARAAARAEREARTRAEQHSMDYVTGRRLGSFFTACFPVQAHLLDEFLARFHGPNRRHWYLSDGGHFENTAAYELVRRRVPFIVVCDCGCDPKYQFDDLAALTRIVRVDFAAEIEFLSREELPPAWPPELRRLFGAPADFALPKADAQGPAAPRQQPHALLGWVKYPDARGEYPPGGERSLLLVLKPGLSGDEPADVANYQQQMPDFPQESTLDQYFDEAQWESYRKLGRHLAEKVFADHRHIPNVWLPCSLSQTDAPPPPDHTTA